MNVIGYDMFGQITVVLDDVTLTVVPDVPANRYRQIVAEWEAEGNTIPPYVAPEPENLSYRLYKSVFINRMTEAEAVTLEGVLAAADAKLRLMFNSVEYFVSDDPLFDTLRSAVAAALTSTRADELLGP